ncbi:MAG: hypothetical protein NC828_06170, partial [Candidatus Omnitrophica bacterium]|nr:hypothetical protein [Candidatus Omnitrophota bacterium]
AIGSDILDTTSGYGILIAMLVGQADLITIGNISSASPLNEWIKRLEEKGIHLNILPITTSLQLNKTIEKFKAEIREFETSL